MLQPRAAARRFYNAFYLWNVASCSSHFRSLNRRALTVRTVQTHGESPRPAPQLQGSKRKQQRQTRDGSRSQASTNVAAQDGAVRLCPSRTLELPGSWTTSTPTPSNELPVHSLAPFQEVIRSRSSIGLTIQTSIPTSSLARLRTRYGADLAGLAQLSGARVELGQTGITSYTELRKPIQTAAVTFSGFFTQCLAVRAELRAEKRHLKSHLKSSRASVRFHGVGEPRHEGLVRMYESTPATSIPSPQPQATSPQAHTTSVQKIPEKAQWLSYNVKTQSDRPSRFMRPLSLVLRHRSDEQDNYVVELAIPYKRWTYITKLMPFSQIQQYCDAKMVLLDEFAAHKGRNITIEGTVTQVDECIKFIFGLIARAREQDEAIPWADQQAQPESIPFEETGGIHYDSDRPTDSSASAHKETVRQGSAKDGLAESKETTHRQTRDDIPDAAPAAYSAHSNIRPIGQDFTTGGRKAGQQPNTNARLFKGHTTFDSGVNFVKTWDAAPLIHAVALDQRPYSTQSRTKRAASRLQDRSGRFAIVHGLPKVSSRSYSSATEFSQTSEDLKRALRPLTHPVALIASRMLQNEQSDQDLNQCRGVTVSSFNTVAMSPPIVSFNLRVPSRSWDAIQSLRRMTIHLLSATPQGAAVAHAFTQPYEQPGEPFRRLRSLGVKFEMPVSAQHETDRHSPPRLSWDGAIIAQIDAKLLEDKSVMIGDHIVVFAEVTWLALPNSTASDGEEKAAVDHVEGLAYALRGFRGVGTNIEPVAIPDSSNIEPGLSEYVADEIDADATNRSEAPTTTRVLDPAHNAAPTEVQIETDIDAEKLERESQVPLRSTPNTPQRSSSQASPLFSATKARPSSITGQQWRPYSVSYAPGLNTPQDRVKEEDGARSVHDMVSDPALLSATVDDFLGIPYRPVYKSRRIRGLIRAQQAAQEASQQLESMLADGSLTSEESTRLENIVTRNERHVAKTLALRSAQDLQRMLDEGKVDSRRVQWIETSVERGQAVLLDEARQLRKSLDERSITLQQFELVKSKLEEENDFLATELMRLRQLVDEESEGGAAEKETTKFDGFEGNV